MNLKPMDAVILHKLVVIERAPWTYRRLPIELPISQSEAYASGLRAIAARLMSDPNIELLAHVATTRVGRPPAFGSGWL